MKKFCFIFLSLVSIFLLTGCFGSNGSDGSGGLRFDYEVIDFVRLKNFSANEEGNICVATSSLEYGKFIEYMKFHMTSEANSDIPDARTVIDPDGKKYDAEFFLDNDLVFIYAEDGRSARNIVTDVRYMSSSGELEIDIAKTVRREAEDGISCKLILVTVPKTGCSSVGFNVTNFVQTGLASRKEVHTNVSVVTGITDRAIFSSYTMNDGSTENFICEDINGLDLKVGDRIVTVSSAVYSDGKNRTFSEPVYLAKYSEENSFAAVESFLYFYCGEAENSSVKTSLNADGIVFDSFPKYDNGWSVSVSSDGSLVGSSGERCDYLFWKGFLNEKYDLTYGYCVSGGETEAFFTKKAEEVGFSEKEAKKFVSYWTEKLKSNKYNFISFSSYPYSGRVSYEFSKPVEITASLFVTAVPLESRIDVPQPQQPTANLVSSGNLSSVQWGGVVLPSEVFAEYESDS